MPARNRQSANETQNPLDLSEISSHLASISKSFAVIAMRLSPTKPASVAERAKFLSGLGLETRDIAKILGTTPGTVSVKLSEAKNSGKRRKRSGKN